MHRTCHHKPIEGSLVNARKMLMGTNITHGEDFLPHAKDGDLFSIDAYFDPASACRQVLQLYVNGAIHKNLPYETPSPMRTSPLKKRVGGIVV